MALHGQEQNHLIIEVVNRLDNHGEPLLQHAISVHFCHGKSNCFSLCVCQVLGMTKSA